jgi:hypothetical protein
MNALMLALVLAAAPPRIFMSVDRVFLPDQPGASVRVELEGSHSLDVRLYQLRDPERFLPGEEGGRSLSERLAGVGVRAPSAAALVSGTAAALKRDAHTRVEPLLTEPALAALRLLAPGSIVETSNELPFLRGEPLLKRWTLPCGGAEAHSYCDVDLGSLPSGVYLVEGIAAGHAGYAVVLVSRLALAARRLPGQLLLFATDARTGEGWSNAQVLLQPEGQPAWKPVEGITGPQGTLLLTKPPARRLSVLAHVGADWAVLDLDYFDARAHGPRAWLSTDQGEVRPGHALHVIGLERPAPSLSREVVVTLEDGRGTAVASSLCHQDEHGLLSGEIAVPEGSATGLAHLVADLDGREVSGEVWLRNPPRAELSAHVSLAPDGQHGLLAAIHAADGEGRPVPARIEWKLFRTPLELTSPVPDEGEVPLTEELAAGESRTSDDGVAAVPLSLPSGPDARIEVEVAAIDGWGRRAVARANLVRLRGPVHLLLEPERRIYSPGETARLSVTSTDSEGRAAPVSLTIHASVARSEAGGEPQTTALPPIQVSVPPTGQTEFALPNLQPGYYEVEATAGSGTTATRLAEAVLFVSQKGGDIPYTPDALTLVPDKGRYSPGDTARVLIFAPFESATALFSAESSEFLKDEVLVIHGSSAIAQVKVGNGPGLTFSATAVFAGQSYERSRTVAVGPASGPLSLSATLEPSNKPGQLELKVHARDAQGRPWPNAQVVASWRDAEAEPPLAPPLATFMDPEPVAEGRTDVSLGFRSTGYSAGPKVSRGEHARSEFTPAEGFTPQKGLREPTARPLHSTLAGLERLMPTDKLGFTHLTFATVDARRVAVELVGVAPGSSASPASATAPSAANSSEANGANGKPVSVAQFHVEASVPWITAEALVPRVLRPGDITSGRVVFQTGDEGGGQVRVDGQPVGVLSSGTEAKLALDFAHPSFLVESGGRTLLSGRVPVNSGEEWVSSAAGELPSGRSRWPGVQEGTLRLRLFTGPLGLLRLLEQTDAVARTEHDREHEHEHERESAPSWEQVHPPGSPIDEVDEVLSRLGLTLARAELSGEPSPLLQSALAQAVGLLSPDGSLGSFRGGPFDRARTATALWMFEAAHALGAEAPAEWRERMRARLLQNLDKPGPHRALSALALASGDTFLPSALVPALLSEESADHLDPDEHAALVLLLHRLGNNRADEVAVHLEHRASSDHGLPCWAPDGCEANETTLVDTTWVTLALAATTSSQRPSPRLTGALRYLLETRDQASWGKGLSGALLPLALARGRHALPDAASDVSVTPIGGGRSTETHLAAGASSVVYLEGGPVFARVHEGPVFFELASARAEPVAASGELTLERRWFIASRKEGKLERTALSGPVPRGAQVWVELEVKGASPGEAVRIEDRFPAGLEPIEQAGAEGPLGELLKNGGAATFSSDRAILHAVAHQDSLVVGYLARARLAGHFFAPSATADEGEHSGRSTHAELDVSEAP